MGSPDVQGVSPAATYYPVPRFQPKVTELSQQKATEVIQHILRKGPREIWSKLDFSESYFVRACGFLLIAKEAKYLPAEAFSTNIDHACSYHPDRIFLEGEEAPRSVENCLQRRRDNQTQSWNDLVGDPIFVSRDVKNPIHATQKKSKLQTSNLALPKIVRILTIAGFASAFYFRETRAGECFALGTATFAVISRVKGLDEPKQKLASAQLRRLRLGTFTAATLAMWNFVHYVAKPLAKMNIRFVSSPLQTGLEKVGKFNIYIQIAALLATGALVTYGLERGSITS